MGFRDDASLGHSLVGFLWVQLHGILVAEYPGPKRLYFQYTARVRV